VERDPLAARDPDPSYLLVWILGLAGAALGVIGGFLPFYRGSSFHWIDLAGDNSAHLPILGAAVRGLIAPGLVAWAAFAGLGGRVRLGAPLMLGASVVWLAWMLANWIDYASGDVGEKAGFGLIVMLIGAALAVAGGIVGTVRVMREEPA
jgi:hypothetical protein